MLRQCLAVARHITLVLQSMAVRLLRPCRWLPVPALRSERSAQRFREWPGITRGDVGLDVARLPHPRDHRADVGIGEDEAQRQLGHGHLRRDQWLERIGMLHTGKEVVGHKVGVSPVPLGPAALLGQRAGERAFAERDTGDDPRILRSAVYTGKSVAIA